jgi:FkbM family methyltransferase
VISGKSVSSAYLLVYRAYAAVKRSLIDPVFLRSRRARRGFDRAKIFVRRKFFASRRLWLQVQSGFATGMWMRLQIPEEAGFWRGEHEPEVQAVLSAIVRPGDVVYDVGAHIGSHALGAARLVGANGKVVAFDGDPENIAHLSENVSRNTLSATVQIVYAAVWSHPSQQEISFRRARAGTSQGGVETEEQHPMLADGELVRVPVITLDAFVAAGGPPPQVIKVDVEGGEWEVLRGAESLLRKHQPALIVEVHHQQADAQIRLLFDELHYAADWKIPKENFPRVVIAWPADRDPRLRPYGSSLQG